MNTKTPFIILSAELVNENNVYRTSLLKDMLLGLNLNFHEAIGCYKGTKEQSFFVTPKDTIEMQAITDIAFNQFNQESVLTQDSAGVSYLEYQNGSIERLGAMIEVTDVTGLDAYTKINNRYYTVK